MSLFESADCIVSNVPSNKALKDSNDDDGQHEAQNDSQVMAPLLRSRRSAVSAKIEKPAPTASVSQAVDQTNASDEFDKLFEMVEKRGRARNNSM